MQNIALRTSNELRQSSDGRTTIAVINSLAEDRHGTIIDPDGVSLANYNRNPVFLINHDYGLLAGNGAIVRKQDGKLIAEVPDDAWDDEDMEIARWKRKVKSGKMKMTSIGFTYDYNDVEEQERTTEDGSTYMVPVIKKSELLEFSFVTVGSNPDALVLQRTAASENADILKETKQLIVEALAKLNAMPDREFLRNVVDEAIENRLPQVAAPLSPEKETPAAPVVDREALIKAEAQRLIEQIKREKGQR